MYGFVGWSGCCTSPDLLATCTVRGLDKADIGIFGSTTTEASSARLHLLCVPRSPEHLLQRLTGWPFLRWGRGHHCGDWLHGQATFCSGQGSVSCWDMALCEVGVQQELEYSKNSGHVPRVPQRIASLTPLLLSIVYEILWIIIQNHTCYIYPHELCI